MSELDMTAHLTHSIRELERQLAVTRAELDRERKRANTLAGAVAWHERRRSHFYGVDRKQTIDVEGTEVVNGERLRIERQRAGAAVADKLKESIDG